MPTYTTALRITVLVEEDTDRSLPPAPNGWRSTNEDIRKAVTQAIAQLLMTRPGVTVEWESDTIIPLDGKPGVGRCAECNRWVFDLDNVTQMTPTCISRGATFEGRLLCDEHLPPDHPHAF